MRRRFSAVLLLPTLNDFRYVQKTLPSTLSPCWFKCKLERLSNDLSMWSLSKNVVLCFMHKFLTKLLKRVILLAGTRLSYLLITLLLRVLKHPNSRACALETATSGSVCPRAWGGRARPRGPGDENDLGRVFLLW